MKTIFIIDDEKRIRDIYKTMIQLKGYSDCRILEAENAEDATECLIRESVDVILLDIRMPMINGKVMWDVIREYNPSIKVIVSSVYPIEEQKKMIPGADRYYDKSWGPVRLIDEILQEL